MSEFTDRAISVLRAHHDELADVVDRLPTDRLTGPSGAADWTVAQVLSHLGSGAEIMLPAVRAAVEGGAPPEQDNPAIWARWDASTPQEQARGFVEHDARLVELLESVPADQRDVVRVDLGFLPDPVPLDGAVALRLNEVAAHAWDVRVATDPDAPLDADAAQLLAEAFSGDLAFMLGFIGHADALGEPAVVAVEDFTLSIGDGVRLSTGAPTEPSATFDGPLEAAVRLLTGRLRPDVTPADVRVTGSVSVEDLRRVFPGF